MIAKTILIEAINGRHPEKTKYSHINYGGGFAIKCNPSDRAVDVMHALITGRDTGLCGRPLEGVEVEVIDQPDATKMLSRSMEIK